ncbi:MAG: (Fe-S)-binding protein [Methylophilus sp.]|nr:(Fe-S)-binding protein [Methylophilus sp.]
MTLSIQQTIQEADRCVACGLCLPHCPTYFKTGSEADSPRGRIQLMSAVAKEILPNNDRFKAHMNACLSCRNCETACPNGVRYGALIDQARVITAQTNWLTQLFGWFAGKPTLLRYSSQFLRFGQSTGLLSLLSKTNATLAKYMEMLPVLTATQSWQACYTAKTSKVGDVSLFLGCITNAFDAETLRASIHVLTHLGYDVHIPPSQSCCGGIARQQGDAQQAKTHIDHNIQAFQNTWPVLTVASGCGAGLKDYTSLPVQDVSDFLMQCDWNHVQLNPLDAHIALHEPCTLRNVIKAAKPVAALLNKIPQLRITPMKGNQQCCGGAGTYMLNQPEMAEALLADKMKWLEQETFDFVATSNIGCAMQLGSGIRRANRPINIMHPVTIIAKQMGFQSELD